MNEQDHCGLLSTFKLYFNESWWSKDFFFFSVFMSLFMCLLISWEWARARESDWNRSKLNTEGEGQLDLIFLIFASTATAYSCFVLTPLNYCLLGRSSLPEHTPHTCGRLHKLETICVCFGGLVAGRRISKLLTLTNHVRLGGEPASHPASQPARQTV